MTDLFKVFIDFIGVGNFLTILLFIVGLFFAYYFYYRTFYRLIYSTGTVCLTCKKLKDWRSNEHSFKTRVLFYNNGRKTITKFQSNGLKILSADNGIKSARVLENEDVTLRFSDNCVNIDFDHLDARNFFTVEVEHFENIEVKGRVAETGNILHTEPKWWLVTNMILFVPILGLIFYTYYEFEKAEDIIEESLSLALNVTLMFFSIWLLRFIHSLFFIPDNISSKYLDAKSKAQSEFKNEL